MAPQATSDDTPYVISGKSLIDGDDGSCRLIRWSLVIAAHAVRVVLIENGASRVIEERAPERIGVMRDVARWLESGREAGGAARLPARQ
jgi:hypothetical protein